MFIYRISTKDLRFDKVKPLFILKLYIYKSTYMKKFFSLFVLIFCYLLFNSINFWNAWCTSYECTIKYNERIEKYNESLENKDYISCLYALEQAKEYSDYKLQEINSQIQNIAEYLWGIYAQKEEYSEALKYYTKSINISEHTETLYNIWWTYYKLEEYKKWIPYLNKAKQRAQDTELYDDITKLLDYMNKMSEYEDIKKNRKANDEYWFYQYYLSWINVFEARDKLPQNKNNVIIAIIDDGVNINHPDLKGRIWINKGEILWDGIDNDNNWYIDDYNWRNFVENKNQVSSPWNHGTMVAWIIAANINNEIWISWIVPTVEIMPLTVFWETWSANWTDIIKAIDYATDNWANIINLSLTQEDKSLYNDYYDSAIKRANKKWIIIVISAWNGDELKTKGINTTTTKISPVCNENNKKNIIWVWSLNKTWSKSEWSNYWECVDFFIYWEDIYTTAVNPNWEPYGRGEWTSFSAPIVSWIIWLWYNKFWQISPDTIYDNLKNSMDKYIINASKYLDNLSTSIWELGISISWLINNWFTVAKNINEFNYNKNIRRDEAAKLFVLYANILNKNIAINDDYSCIFSDLWEVQWDLTSYVIDACRYWIFSWKNWKFMPKSGLTNAQIITAFMRLVSWKMDENWTHFADRYFIEAYRLWLINWLVLWDQNNYEKNTTRWEFAILLHRWLTILNKN